jgi:hypothetical protein
VNLHAAIRGAINSINPNQQISWSAYQSCPIDTNTGIATPQYAAAQPIWAQIQPLSTDQLKQMEQLNIQGVLREVRMKGAVASGVRQDGTGGDLLQFPELPGGPMRTWMVMAVPEQWPTWCCVIARMQNDQTGSA